VAESVLVALKQKVHELTEMTSDQAAMEELYTAQIRTLEAQLHTVRTGRMRVGITGSYSVSKLQ
jgi:phage host-nuclease inhibitor protein Gam